MKQFEMYELTIKGEEPQGLAGSGRCDGRIYLRRSDYQGQGLLCRGWKLQGALLPKSGRHLYLSCERSDAGRGQSGMSAE